MALTTIPILIANRGSAGEPAPIPAFVRDGPTTGGRPGGSEMVPRPAGDTPGPGVRGGTTYCVPLSSPRYPNRGIYIENSNRL